jgi:ATP-dependent protease ClpP protease subunit
MIKSLNNKGHETTCIVDGLAASIATVIMCACQKIVINESSMIMIHNCWSVVQGDSNALRKEADVMDVMNDAILSFYRSKFDLTDEQLKQYMNDELWFSGKEASNFGFKCEVIPDANDFAIAAKVKKFDLTKFNIPQILVGSNMEKEELKEIEKLE